MVHVFYEDFLYKRVLYSVRAYTNNLNQFNSSSNIVLVIFHYSVKPTLIITFNRVQEVTQREKKLFKMCNATKDYSNFSFF